MPTKKPAPDDFISLQEASALYKFSAAYLRDIALSGRLKAKKIGHYWVTTPAWVEEYVASRTKKGAYRDDIDA